MNKKQFNDWRCLEETKEFFRALSVELEAAKELLLVDKGLSDTESLALDYIRTRSQAEVIKNIINCDFDRLACVLGYPVEDGIKEGGDGEY